MKTSYDPNNKKIPTISSDMKNTLVISNINFRDKTNGCWNYNFTIKIKQNENWNIDSSFGL